MHFGKLDINPANNPAILDTATWNMDSAWKTVQALDEGYWHSLEDAVANGTPAPSGDNLTPYPASCVCHQGILYCLAGLADGQQVFLELGNAQAESILGAGGRVKSFSATGKQLVLHPTDAPVLDRFFRLIVPEKGPRALGPLPRLGIGTRMDDGCLACDLASDGARRLCGQRDPELGA